MSTIAIVTIVEQECGDCGIVFGMPSDFRDRRIQDHRTWYCPNGHQRHYIGETEEQKLRRQLKAEQDHATRLVAERDQMEASRRAWKGQATRARNRSIGGDCPICGKHVYGLARHVARIHPDEKPESES